MRVILLDMRLAPGFWFAHFGGAAIMRLGARMRDALNKATPAGLLFFPALIKIADHNRLAALLVHFRVRLYHSLML
jgi:hypothetical protein